MPFPPLSGWHLTDYSFKDGTLQKESVLAGTTSRMKDVISFKGNKGNIEISQNRFDVKTGKLLQEMKPFNIKVTSIFPGRVNTLMIENIKVPLITKKIPPEKVVKAILKAIKGNKANLIVPSVFSFVTILNYLMPHFSDWA